MSIKVAARVWEHSKLRGTQKLVLLALADFANDAGLCWPSTATLAGRIGESERYTREIIAQLVASGDLLRQAGGGRGKVSRYGVATGLDPQQREKLNHALQNSVSENTDTEATMTETLHSGDGNPALQCHETLHYSDEAEGANSAPGSPETTRSAGGIRHVDPSENQKSIAPVAADAAPSPPAPGKKPKAERKPRAPKADAPEEPVTPAVIRHALAEVCLIGKTSSGEVRTDAAVRAKAIWRAYRDAQTDEEIADGIRYVGEWCRTGAWQCRDGSAPRPKMIGDYWDQAMAARQKQQAAPAANGRHAAPVPLEDEEPAYAAQQRRAALLAQAREHLRGPQP